MFWIAFSAVAYTYCGYLLLLVGIDAAASLRENARALRQGPQKSSRAPRDEELPKVSVLIAAHNEEAVIRAKLINTLQLDYPKEKLQILVGSDGSGDQTEEIVKDFIRTTKSQASRPPDLEKLKASGGSNCSGASTLSEISEQEISELEISESELTKSESSESRISKSKFSICGDRGTPPKKSDGRPADSKSNPPKAGAGATPEIKTQAQIELSAAPRGGKVAVLNRLAQQATGELWLFTDANTWIDSNALRAMVRRLADPGLGAVCGRLMLLEPGTCKLLCAEGENGAQENSGTSDALANQSGAGSNEGLYWQYENLLKFYESRRGSLMGANGGLYLLRAEAWEPLPEDTIVDDFVITMRVLLQNKQLVYEPNAVGSEETAADLKGEFKRRVRIASGNFQSLHLLAPLLLMPSFSSLAFFSHKILRWLVPWFMLLMFGTSFLLIDQKLYRLLFGAQVAFYLAALLSRQGLAPAALKSPFRLAQYLVEMNLALALGLLRHLRGKHSAIWQRTERVASEARRKVA